MRRRMRSVPVKSDELDVPVDGSPIDARKLGFFQDVVSGEAIW